MPHGPRARLYNAIHITAWACACAAGDVHAAWQACAAGRSACRPVDGVWLAPIGSTPHTGDPVALLAPLSRPLVADWPLTTLPGLAVSASKGDVSAWLAALAGAPAELLRAVPGSVGPRLAAQLGWQTFIGTAPVAACSSGLYALLGLADLLEEGACEQGLAASIDTALHPFLCGAYRNMGVLARRQPTAFAQPSTGFAVGEGAAALTLAHHGGPWRLRAGVRLGDASHPTRCEDPQTLRACLEALWDAAPAPDLIVAHATGTRSGDAYEQAGLDQGPWARVPRLLCKPIIGHCLGASGLVELAIACEAPVQVLWKLSLGFGGHIAGIAIERSDRAP